MAVSADRSAAYASMCQALEEGRLVFPVITLEELIPVCRYPTDAELARAYTVEAWKHASLEKYEIIGWDLAVDT